MENAPGILIMLSLTTFLQNSTGQVLSDESLFQHHSCYGSNGDYSIVNASCSADTVIAVSTVQAGAKLNNSSCPVAVDENTTVDFEYCCKIKVDDCAVNVSTTIWHALCSGNESCLATRAVSVPSNCISMFRSNTSNMQLDYYCINITRIGSTCTHVTMTTFDNALYLWNSGYPYGVNTDTDCVCSIQVESCDAHIDVTAMRIDLKDDNGTCIQNITFSDSYGTPEMVIDCSKLYDITSLFTSRTNYLLMNLISDRNNTLGKYWIRFKATEAKSNLQVDCNPAEQQMSCTTTSTKSTSSTKTTTTPKTTTATTRRTSATNTRTPPTTAAPTITTKIISMTTGKTEEKQQEDLRYIAYATLCVPIAIAILYLFRRRHPVMPHNQVAARTPSVISLPDKLKSMFSETDSQTEVTFNSSSDEKSNHNTATNRSTDVNATPRTTTTETETTSTTITTSRSQSSLTIVSDLQPEVAPNSEDICSHNVQHISFSNDGRTTTSVSTTHSKPRTSTITTETTPPSTRSSIAPTVISVLTSNQPSLPPCACSYCGQLGKHYHPIASSSRKYRKRKHFRCRYCGIFWNKTTSLPLYSPCPFISNKS